MTGYVKLFQSILGSSIWAGPDAWLRVWIAMLVLKTRDHRVTISVPGLANISRVSPEECRAAIESFKKPDADSTCRLNEGRKIEDLPEGGWLILNGERYAKMLSYDERKEYNRVKQAEYRKRKKEIRVAGKKAGAKQAIKEGFSEQQRQVALQQAEENQPNGDCLE